MDKKVEKIESPLIDSNANLFHRSFRFSSVVPYPAVHHVAMSKYYNGTLAVFMMVIIINVDVLETDAFANALAAVIVCVLSTVFAAVVSAVYDKHLVLAVLHSFDFYYLVLNVPGDICDLHLITARILPGWQGILCGKEQMAQPKIQFFHSHLSNPN